MSEAHCGTKEDFDNHIKSIGAFAKQSGYEVTPVGFEAGKLLLPGMHMHGTLKRDASGKLSFEPDVIEIPKADVKPGQFKSMFLNSWPWGEREKVEALKEAERKEQEKHHYEYMKAKCHANPGQYGVGMILSDGTWISHEEAIALAHHRPSVNYRNVAGAGEIPFLMTEYGMISEKDLLPVEDKRAAKGYAERQEQAKLSDKHTGTITAHSLNADGSESMSITFEGLTCLTPSPEVKSARDLLDEGIAQILQKCNASDLMVIPCGYDLIDAEGKVVGNSNSGIEKHVSGKDFLDVLLPVPPLTPEAPPEPAAISIPFPTVPDNPFIVGQPGVSRTPIFDNFKQTLKDAGIDVDAERVRMREDGFYKRIMPPVQITNDELDRSVPTNLPVDPARDDPYQAFRRERHLPDTEESAKLYQQYLALPFQTLQKTGYLRGPRRGRVGQDDVVLTDEQAQMVNADVELFKSLSAGVSPPADPEAIKTMNEAIFEKLSERATPTNPAMVDAVNEFTRHAMKTGGTRVALPTPDEDDPQPIIVKGE
jgi:hypothetical protein